MTEVAATEFTRNFGRVRQDVHYGPVTVRSHNQVAGYFLSPRDFDEYQRLKALAAKALAVEDLDARTVDALRSTRMDDRHADLDRLLDD
jgi:PHD/YefM family antitoxin component YafN of YafNO toxin-antitoxin module